MSATTYTTPSDTGPATTINRHLKAEWTKLRTLPSTWRTTALAATLAIGFTAAVDLAQLSRHSMTAQQYQSFDATSASLFGVIIAATLLGALAVRTVTAEYATGMIRSTFAAMPARRLVLAAKAATVAAFVLPVALLCDVVGFELGQRIFAGDHLQVALSHPGVARAIVFGAVAASLVAIIGVGLGGLIRHTAGATTTLTDHRRRRHPRPAAPGRPTSVPARNRHPGGHHGTPLRRAAHPRRGDRGPRRVCRHRPRRSTDPGGAPRRLTNLIKRPRGTPCSVPRRTYEPNRSRLATKRSSPGSPPTSCLPHTRWGHDVGAGLAASTSPTGHRRQTPGAANTCASTKAGLAPGDPRHPAVRQMTGSGPREHLFVERSSSAIAVTFASSLPVIPPR
jgi:hypothetical protein